MDAIERAKAAVGRAEARLVAAQELAALWGGTIAGAPLAAGAVARAARGVKRAKAALAKLEG